MNETLKTLITRRSVRNFKSDMIPEDILNQILLAGEYAPTAKNMQESVGEGLSFGNQPTKNVSVGGDFELVGNKASQKEIAKGAKFKSHRRTESRFCGHSAWFFSFANLFVCLLFLLCNILISNATEEMIAAGGTIATIQAILDKSPYVTLVVLAFTLIAIINNVFMVSICRDDIYYLKTDKAELKTGLSAPRKSNTLWNT